MTTEIKFFGENGKIYFLENGVKKYVTEEEKDKLLLGYIYNNKGELEKTEEILLKEKQEKIKEIKKTCEKTILDKYPMYKQVNMGADIQEIHLIARQEEREFTQDEMQTVGEALAMKTWIAEQRALCDEEIKALEPIIEQEEILEEEKSEVE